MFIKNKPVSFSNAALLNSETVYNQAIHKITVNTVIYASHLHTVSYAALPRTCTCKKRKDHIYDENPFFFKLKCISFASLHGHILETNVSTNSGQKNKSKLVNPFPYTALLCKHQHSVPSKGGSDFSNPNFKQTATIYLQSTRNNTICTLVNCQGEAVFWNSAGSIGFKNTRKSTTYAAQAVAEKIAAKTLEKGFFSVRVLVKGLGYGKQSGVRALFKSGLKIVSIEEITPVSYNGSRPRKKRRV